MPSMDKKARALLVACLAVFSFACLADRSSAELVKGYPDALVCNAPKGKIVIYLHTVEKTGEAIYMKQDGDFAVLKKDGTVLRNNKPVPGCEKRVFTR